MDKGLTAHTKMGADKSAENTPMAPTFIMPKLSIHWASVVRATNVDKLRHKSRRTAFRTQSAIQNKPTT